MNKILYLVRGLPGAGKSTLAHLISENVCEADLYFMKTGEYQFDMNKLALAHQWCRGRCESLMIDNVSTIVVSNTLTSEKELQPYTELAEQYRYGIVSLVVENRHGNKSIHNVPDDTLDKMEARLKSSIKLK
jgi:predicted kinase